VEGFDVSLKGTNNYADIAGSDVVIVTAGLPRKPGMSRDDLIGVNSKIMSQVAEGSRRTPQTPSSSSSPTARRDGDPRQKITGFPPTGSSGRPASSIRPLRRLHRLGARRLRTGRDRDDPGWPRRRHGPLIRYASVAGIPVMELLERKYGNAAKAKEVMAAMVNRTRKAGGEVVALLKTGSAFFSPASAAIAMVESILKDQKRVLRAAYI